MDRDIIDYYPGWLREYEEIQKLADALQKTFTKYWDAEESLWNNNFVDDMDENGCEKWEKMLNLADRENYTLEERRLAVKAYILDKPPYTLNKLKDILAVMCEYELLVNDFNVFIRCEFHSLKMLRDAKKIIARIVPANMVLDMNMKYNTYEMLNSSSYGTLASKNYIELREEIVE